MCIFLKIVKRSKRTYRLSVVTTTPFVKDYDVVGALFAEAKRPGPSRPSYVIRLLKYQSQRFALCTRFRAGIRRRRVACSRCTDSPLLLFVWTRSSKMQQQSAELVERTSSSGGPTSTRGMHADFLSLNV